jgi:DTW domain-containing protein
MCPRCYLKSAQCICSWLPHIVTRTEILVIRHVTETHAMSNTGRLAALLMPNCRIIDYAAAASRQLAPDITLDAKNTWLLYPGQNPPPAMPPPERLVVLDASFRRAKRMYHRIDALRPLPELALPAPEIAPHRLRQPPRADGMSTIEAIAAGLSLVEDPRLGAMLGEAYAEFVRRADLAHGRLRRSDGSTPDSVRCR